MTRAQQARSLAAKVDEQKKNLLVSLKRTLVPILVGSIASSFLGPYIDQAVIQSFVSGVISAVYYTSVRLVEMLWPDAGILLGSKAQPAYEEPKE